MIERENRPHYKTETEHDRAFATNEWVDCVVHECGRIIELKKDIEGEDYIIIDNDYYCVGGCR